MTKEQLQKRMSERFAWWIATKQIGSELRARINSCLLPITDYRDFHSRRIEYKTLCVACGKLANLDAIGTIKGFWEANNKRQRMSLHS